MLSLTKDIFWIIDVASIGVFGYCMRVKGVAAEHQAKTIVGQGNHFESFSTHEEVVQGYSWRSC